MMFIQSSYQSNSTGTLYIVPTPIGNLEDITFRAIKTLTNANLIAAEDTRHTQKLLNHYEIQTPLISYYEHNEKERTVALIERLKDGDSIALVSDAGMPAISDPGHELIQEAIEEKINIIVLPGANAALCALVGSGIPTNEFLFYGFLPRKRSSIEQTLKRLSTKQATIIFYESPYRIKSTLKHISTYFGERKLTIAREITKIYEQYIRGTTKQVIEWVDNNHVKGECCIIIEGSTKKKDNDTWWKDLTIGEHVQVYEREHDLGHKEALKQVAIDRGVSRKDIYHHIHVLKDK